MEGEMIETVSALDPLEIVFCVVVALWLIGFSSTTSKWGGGW